MDSKDCLQGDLNDIIRSSYGSCISSTLGTRSSDHHWMFLSDPMDLSCVFEQDHHRSCSFGDPFSNMRDPFLHQLDMAGEFRGGGVLEDAACFGDVAVIGRSGDNNNSNNNNNNCVLAKENIIVAEDDDMMMRRPPYCNNIILSNMIQISPKANCKLPIISSTCSSVDSPKIVKTSTSAVVSVAGNMINAASTSNNKADHGLLVEHKTGAAAAGLQMSSPRNNPAAGLKHRRKNQATKSICIPAPTAPNSRQSGEVVPSDLWAWRKYGQKPIKGSPYPRGYYRCSSSKGCPARKQVERSRTDPNMLVITYTSEHNHPWPTQRNALAGSSRSQPSKNNIINSASASKNNNYSAEATDDEPHKGTTINLPQEEEQDSNTSTENSGNNNHNDAYVKEEMDDGMMEKQQLEMDVDDDDGRFRNGSSVVPYKNNNKQLLEELFAKLGEMEADDADHDSMKGLIDDNHNAVDHQQIRESKSFESFHVFGWSGENSITRYHLI